MTTMNRLITQKEKNMNNQNQNTEEFLDNFEIYLEKNKLLIHPKQKQAIIKSQAEIFKKNQEIRKAKQ